MKSVVNHNEENKIIYPVIMIHSLGAIVLFTEPGVGTRLDGDLGCGRHSEKWDMSKVGGWKVFYGSITLSN